MDIVLIVGLFCALIFLTHLSDKNVDKLPHEPPLTPPLPPTPPKRFVSVVFKEGQTQTYDYFFEDNLGLMVNDLVEVPVNDRFTGRRELKIAIVKYVSAPGERSPLACATVIRRLPNPPTPSPKPVPPTPKSIPSSPPTPPKPPKPSTAPTTLPQKRFVQVIFKKRSKRRFDYLLGDNNDIRVGDFVVVHVSNGGKITWKIAKVMYISKPGEVSEHARSTIIKKADYPKW